MANSHVAIPALSGGRMMLLGTLEALRDLHDPSWCRKNLVGRLRRYLGAPTPTATDALTTLPTSAEVERNADALALQALCKVCGRCRMSRE